MAKRQKSYTLGFRVDERQKELIEEIAWKEGRGVGEILREALAEWLSKRYPSLPLKGDKSLEAFVDLVEAMKKDGRSWNEISREVEDRFGLKLEKPQLKAFVR